MSSRSRTQLNARLGIPPKRQLRGTSQPPVSPRRTRTRRGIIRIDQRHRTPRRRKRTLALANVTEHRMPLSGMKAGQGEQRMTDRRGNESGLHTTTNAGPRITAIEAKERRTQNSRCLQHRIPSLRSTTSSTIKELLSRHRITPPSRIPQQPPDKQSRLGFNNVQITTPPRRHHGPERTILAIHAGPRSGSRGSRPDTAAAETKTASAADDSANTRIGTGSTDTSTANYAGATSTRNNSKADTRTATNAAASAAASAKAATRSRPTASTDAAIGASTGTDSVASTTTATAKTTTSRSTIATANHAATAARSTPATTKAATHNRPAASAITTTKNHPTPPSTPPPNLRTPQFLHPRQHPRRPNHQPHPRPHLVLGHQPRDLLPHPRQRRQQRVVRLRAARRTGAPPSSCCRAACASRHQQLFQLMQSYAQDSRDAGAFSW
ncbi:hypothetical protein GCM10009839_54130 [Catenulispora yoronensis]|uniref:Uncharacterized protein n=1 Tax=Catenulispora yoronensis TaxID=450799 RepID=A0ABP5GFU1_9ACTN